MVLSDVILVLHAVKNIAGLAAKEAERSVAYHLKTSSLVPKSFVMPQAPSSTPATAAAAADYAQPLDAAASDAPTAAQASKSASYSPLAEGLATRPLPIALHPGPLSRTHLLRLAERKLGARRQTMSSPELVIKTADLSGLNLHVPPPPIALRSETPNASAIRCATSTQADTQQQQQNGKAKESATTAADYSDLPEEEEETAPKLQASSMPSNRVSRFYHYGSLAVGLGLGALGEATKRWSGFGRSGESSGDASSSLLLTRANIDRIVAKLTKMRGAALKLGQMLSIQDSKDMTPEIAEVLQRVQNSANYVPIAQVDKTMRKQLGPHWRDNFAPFSDEPFAAASIGQVHEAQLSPEMQEKYGFKKVAVKVQYPGVANSIESDLSNLQSLLVMSKLLPRGMYLDNTIKVARKELAWECDYTREADAMVKFGAFLADDPDFEVPRLVGDLSSKMVLTAEHMDGMDMRKLEGYDQETRDYIGTCILRLSLRELFEFEFMQTDPNWANFLYNKATKKIVLLDFGASRGFGKEFLDKYLMTLKTAMDGDREGVRHWSTELGFLTGYEADIMTQAHVDSVLEIGKPFRHQGLYDFGNQDVSDNVRSAIPVMLRHRLTPPPDETYSLHRKLSGAYLLCIKLRARVPCQELFKSITAKYTFGDGTKLTY